jgi:hypothetical protein
MADRSGAGLSVKTAGQKIRRTLTVLVGIAALVGSARATEIKMAGKLSLPPDAGVIAICTDPVVQRILNEDLRGARRGIASDEHMVTLTVTVNEQLLKPGVSLNQMFPGDPSMVELLKAAGADAPALGDSGDQPIDPYETEARRGALTPDDPITAQFKHYQARQQAARGARTPYDSIPENQIYSTVIVARASLEGAPDQMKVVAVVQSGDDARRAKELVAEEIANAILH